jgi:hypothetical protein
LSLVMILSLMLVAARLVRIHLLRATSHPRGDTFPGGGVAIHDGPTAVRFLSKKCGNRDR